MFKSCSRCGKIHDVNYICTVNRKKVNWNKYKTDADRLHQTSEWQEKSLQIRQDAQWLCEICRENGVLTHDGLEVHHIEKVRDNPTLFLNDKNLICLCVPHHKQADRGQLKKEHLKELALKRVQRVMGLTVI